MNCLLLTSLRLPVQTTPRHIVDGIDLRKHTHIWTYSPLDVQQNLGHHELCSEIGSHVAFAIISLKTTI